MTTQDREDILKRVQNLFNLADNHAATQGEVLAALSQAKKIMARYNLDMMEIDAAKMQNDKNSKRWIYEEIEATLPNAKRIGHAGYEGTLVAAVKLITGVQAYWTQDVYKDRTGRMRNRAKLVFAGDRVDIHLARALFETLANSMFQIVYGHYGRTPWTRYHRSFCDGFALEVWMTAKAQQSELSIQESRSYAIVLADKNSWAQDEMRNAHPKMGMAKHKDLPQHLSAYNHGREAGKTQSLSVTRSIERK